MNLIQSLFPCIPFSQTLTSIGPSCSTPVQQFQIQQPENVSIIPRAVDCSDDGTIIVVLVAEGFFVFQQQILPSGSVRYKQFPEGTNVPFIAEPFPSKLGITVTSNLGSGAFASMSLAGDGKTLLLSTFRPDSASAGFVFVVFLYNDSNDLPLNAFTPPEIITNQTSLLVFANAIIDPFTAQVLTVTNTFGSLEFFGQIARLSKSAQLMFVQAGFSLFTNTAAPIAVFNRFPNLTTNGLLDLNIIFGEENSIQNIFLIPGFVQDPGNRNIIGLDFQVNRTGTVVVQAYGNLIHDHFLVINIYEQPPEMFVNAVGIPIPVFNLVRTLDVRQEFSYLHRPIPTNLGFLTLSGDGFTIVFGSRFFDKPIILGDVQSLFAHTARYTTKDQIIGVFLFPNQSFFAAIQPTILKQIVFRSSQVQSLPVCLSNDADTLLAGIANAERKKQQQQEEQQCKDVDLEAGIRVYNKIQSSNRSSFFRKHARLSNFLFKNKTTIDTQNFFVHQDFFGDVAILVGRFKALEGTKESKETKETNVECHGGLTTSSLFVAVFE